MDDETISPSETQDFYHAPLFDWRVRLIPAIVVALLSPLVIDGPISAFVHSVHHEPVVFVLVVIASVEIAKFCLLASWLAWGGSRAVVRVIVVFVSLLFTCVVFGIAGEPGITQAWSLLLLAATGLACLIALPKLFGCRWLSAEELANENQNDGSSRQQLRQFSIVDLFMWTATVAVVAGIIRGLGLPREFADVNSAIVEVLILLCVIVALAIGTLLAIWSVMSRSPWVIRRSILSGAVMIGLFSPLWLMMLNSPHAGEVVFALFGLILVSLSMVIGPLLVLRSFGDRIVRVGRHNRSYSPPKNAA
jgi:hypothetical protein